MIGCLVAALLAADVPVWQREGLGGAVRPEMGSPQPGEAAPDFELPDTAGATVKLSSLRGRWVVLHFTATWCPFCDAEVEHLGTLAKAYAGKNVTTLIVDIKEDPPVWNDYAKKHVDPAVTALRDASGEVAAKYAPPRAQPSFKDRAQAVLDATLILDPDGKIRLFLLPDSKHYDPTFKAVKRELDAFLATAEPPKLLSPDEVVATAATAANGEVTVRLDVADGYHVMSDKPSKPEYIATRVSFEAEPGVTLGEAVYPAATQFDLGEQRIKVFSGRVLVRIPFTAKGAHTLHGQVRFQACTAANCLFPTSKKFSVELGR